MKNHDFQNVKNISGFQMSTNYLEIFMKFVLEIAIFMFKQLQSSETTAKKKERKNKVISV